MAPPIMEIDEAKPGVGKVAIAKGDAPCATLFVGSQRCCSSALLSLPTAFKKTVRPGTQSAPKVLADNDMCDNDPTLHADQGIALRCNDQGRSAGTQRAGDD
jgi:hypothetical protein